jgi:hypothetical protein
VIHVGPGVRLLTAEQLAQAPALRDLADEVRAPHAVNPLVGDIAAGLRAAYGLDPEISRGSRITSAAENHDPLDDPPGGVAHDSRCARSADRDDILRTYVTAVIPGALRTPPPAAGRDRLIRALRIISRRDWAS